MIVLRRPVKCKSFFSARTQIFSPKPPVFLLNSPRRSFIIGITMEMEGHCGMAQIAAVISGKGGTGKTSVCAAVSSSLALSGQRVLCIDCDVGLRNLDLSLGMADLASVTFTSVMRGDYALSDAPHHPQMENLVLLTAPVRETPESLDPARFAALLREAKDAFDWILIDAPAGLGTLFTLATSFCDLAIVVSNADPASMRDAGRASEVLFSARPEAGAKLVVNRVSAKLYKKMRATIDDVMDSVGLPLLGIVPEDADVTLAAASGTPLVLYSHKGAAEAAQNIANRLLGKKTPLMKL